MENKETPKPNYSQTNNTGNKNTFLIIIAVLVLAVVVVGYLYFDSSKSLEATSTELKSSYDQLDSIGKELDVKIAEIERLGGDVAELEEVKAQLEVEKEELWKSKQYTEKQLSRFQAKVEGYRELLVAKDAEIEKLKQVNESLELENRSLKSDKVGLEQNISELKQEQNKLTEKVQIASRLEAENIVVTAINKKGKERTGEFKVRSLEKLRVDFNIASNDVAPIEGKEIFLRVSDSNGEVIFDLEKGSGTFVLDGQESFYTLKQEILFDNTNQKISFLYDKGSQYLPGEYKMEVFTDGYRMGTQKFKVK